MGATNAPVQTNVAVRAIVRLDRIIRGYGDASLAIRYHSAFASFTNTPSIRSLTENAAIANCCASRSLSGELSRLDGPTASIRRRTRKGAVLIALMTCLSVMLPETSYADSEKSSPDEKPEIDGVALAAILVQDGHFDRARRVLREVDPANEGIDRSRYYMLYGLVELKAQNNRFAVRMFRKAVESGQTDPSVHVFLAQGCFAIEDYICAIAALDDAGEAAAKLPGSYLIRSQSHLSLGQNAPALDALEKGLKRFPENYQLMRHKVMLLINLGLFQQALQDGALLMRNQNSSSDDYVAIAEALRRGRQLSAAIKILEGARLRYSNDEQVLKQLARTYLEASLPLSAGRILQEAARINPALSSEVAELYRRAGKPLLALRINSDVADQRVKTKQRLGLLIELGRFEQAEALVPRLSRLGLLGDDQTRYAVAYTYYRTGAYHRAENFIAQIDDPVFFQKAVELRRAIAVCLKDSSAC